MVGLRTFYATLAGAIVVMSTIAFGMNPAHAQPVKTVSGAYVECEAFVRDVRLWVALSAKGVTYHSTNPGTDWYSRLVLLHAEKAVKSDKPGEYLSSLHKACLLETA